jgi:hypothetical protein
MGDRNSGQRRQNLMAGTLEQVGSVVCRPQSATYYAVDGETVVDSKGSRSSGGKEGKQVSRKCAAALA